MKTKELIEALKKEDPSGELEVCVDNQMVHFVEKQPSYYDGCFEKVDFGEKNNIEQCRFIGEGFKMVIHYYGVEDAIDDNPCVPVLYDSISKRYIGKTIKCRYEIIEFLKELDDKEQIEKVKSIVEQELKELEKL